MLGAFGLRFPTRFPPLLSRSFHSSRPFRADDPYSILGVPKNASDSEIRKAFHLKAKKYHPDVNKTPEAAKIFIRVSQAYESIKDAESRAKYNFEHRFGSGFGSAPQPHNHYAQRPQQQQEPQPGNAYDTFRFYWNTYGFDVNANQGSSSTRQSQSYNYEPQQGPNRPFEELLVSFVQGINYGQWQNNPAPAKLLFRLPDRFQIFFRNQQLFSQDEYILREHISSSKIVARLTKMPSNQSTLKTAEGKELGTSEQSSSILKINLPSANLQLETIVKTIIPFIFSTFDMPLSDYNITGFRLSILGLFVFCSSWQRKEVVDTKTRQATQTRRHVATIIKYPLSTWTVHFNPQVSEVDRVLTILHLSIFALPPVRFIRTFFQRIISL